VRVTAQDKVGVGRAKPHAGAATPA
jgi:hypothetical protein